MRRRFVLLDRDGTVIEHVHYLHDPEQVRLVPEAAPSLRSLKERGLGLVLVTNQSGVGRGMFPVEDVHRVNERMHELLGFPFDGVYLCPHAPDEQCECRKPAPGMALQAAADHDFDLTQAFMVGDSDCDIGLGEAVGATTFRIGPELSLAQACQGILAAL